MSAEDLREAVDHDLRNMQRVVAELQALRQDTRGHEPSLRERVAAGAFLTSFYNGVENILKRISIWHGQPVPTSPKWHVELFDRFVDPPAPGLPSLFDANLARALDPYRRFRHIARTTYGLELDWGKIVVGIDRVGVTFERFREAVDRYLETLR